VVAWVAAYILGKAADGIWDRASNAPDIRTLNARLIEVEKVLGDPFRESIVTLRQRLSQNTTQDEYYRYATSSIRSLEVQVSANTQDIRRLETRLDRVELDQRSLAGDLRQYLGGIPAETRYKNEPITLPVDRPPNFDWERLKNEYEKRDKDFVEERNRRTIAKYPWCHRCRHYHPPLDQRGCPRRPATHKPCGTRHFPDEWCPVEKGRIPPPGY
jgi:hypothetical protein